jgi:hypothetical protein
VLRATPDWDALPLDTPAHIRLVLMRCLEKDPRARMGNIGTARFLMTEALPVGRDATHALTPAYGVRRRPAAVAGAIGLLAGGALTAAVISVLPQPSSDDGAYRALLAPVQEAMLTGPEAGRFAVSPDGRQLALVARGADGDTRLWIRPLDGRANAHPLAGTEGAAFPFWSSDGRAVAFTAQGRLKTVQISGGPPLTVCELKLPYGAPGAWAADGTILLTPAVGPIHRVSASGGEPSPVTALNTGRGETVHGWPSLLPDGKHFLYLALVGAPGARKSLTYVASLDGRGEPRPVLQDTGAARYSGGHLLYTRGSTWYLGFGANYTYDVFPDGQRILVNVAREQPTGAPVSLIVNWPALLTR